MLLDPCHPCCVSDIVLTGMNTDTGAWSSQYSFTNSCGEAVFSVADVCYVFIWKPDLPFSFWQMPSPSFGVAEAQVEALPEEVRTGGDTLLNQRLAEGAEEGGEQGKAGNRLVEREMGSEIQAVNL